MLRSNRLTLRFLYSPFCRAGQFAGLHLEKSEFTQKVHPQGVAEVLSYSSQVLLPDLKNKRNPVGSL